MDSLKISWLKDLAIRVEIEKERQELRALGLTEEEVEGCIEFFLESWYSVIQKGKKD